MTTKVDKSGSPVPVELDATPNQSSACSVITSTLKGRLVRDTYFMIKHRAQNPAYIQLLDEAEDLVPGPFDLIDESISSGYLRLVPADPEEFRLLVILQVVLSIQFSLIQASFHSVLILFEVYGQAASASDAAEGYSCQPIDGSLAVLKYVRARCLKVLHLFSNIAGLVYDHLDRDGDGRLGAADLVFSLLRGAVWLGRAAVLGAGLVWYLVLVVLGRVLDLVLPPPEKPLRPQPQFHQSPANRLAEQALERFQRRSKRSISLAALLSAFYDRLRMRSGPWMRIVISAAATVCDVLFEIAQQAVHFCIWIVFGQQDKF